MSKATRQQAKDIQGAGLWNTLGLVQALVAACATADADEVTEESGEIGRRATEILDKAAALAPELVLLALEKLPVSRALEATPDDQETARNTGRHYALPPHVDVSHLRTERSHFFSASLSPDVAIGVGRASRTVTGLLRRR